MSAWFHARQKSGAFPPQEEIQRFSKEGARRRTVTDGQGKLARIVLVPGEHVIEVYSSSQGEADALTR